MQLLDTERMLNVVGDHPLMSVSFLEKKKELELQIADLPLTLKAGSAFDRVSRTVSSMEEIRVMGVFKGALLESWRFDFVDENNHKISGKLADDLTEEAVAELNRHYTNVECAATLEKTTVIFKNGRERTTYVLVRLEGRPST